MSAERCRPLAAGTQLQPEVYIPPAFRRQYGTTHVVSQLPYRRKITCMACLIVPKGLRVTCRRAVLGTGRRRTRIGRRARRSVLLPERQAGSNRHRCTHKNAWLPPPRIGCSVPSFLSKWRGRARMVYVWWLPLIRREKSEPIPTLSESHHLSS